MAKKETFKQSMERLDAIIEALDRNEIELEDAIQLFEEGLQLVKNCDAQLKQFEQRMNVLLADEEEEDAAANEGSARERMPT